MDEKLLYQIMSKFHDNNNPIVFKGALVTKAILNKYNPSGIIRGTMDIDADWVLGKPSMEELRIIIQNIISEIDPSMIVLPKRDYNDIRSAGFVITNPNGGKVTSLDISIRENKYKTLYTLGDFNFYGVTVDKVLADKIAAISSDALIRRVKDILDVYALSHSVTCNKEDILKIMNDTKRVMGDFSYFKNNIEAIHHAYNALSRVENKKSFAPVYVRVNMFITPFYNMERTGNMEWDNHIGEWKRVKSIADIIKEANRSNISKYFHSNEDHNER